MWLRRRRGSSFGVVGVRFGTLSDVFTEKLEHL